MNVGKITMINALSLTKNVELRKVRLVWASVISLLIILVDSILVSKFGVDTLILNTLALVSVLLFVYFMSQNQKFELRKDWIHVGLFIILMILQVGVVKDLFIPIPKFVSICLLLCYPCWIYFKLDVFNNKGRYEEKELLLNLTTISFALLLLALIRSIGTYFYNFNSEVNFLFIEGILEFIFFLFIAGYSIQELKPTNLNSSSEYANTKQQVSVTQSELSDMARKVEESIFDTNFYLYSGISLELVSEKTGYSRQQLAKIFNDYYNKNFYQLLGERRVENAIAEMKRNNNVTMDFLSEKCGFNSKSTFYKYFKNYTGYTPAVFMQNIQNLETGNLYSLPQ